MKDIIQQNLVAALARIAEISAGSNRVSHIAHEAEKTTHREPSTSPEQENISSSRNLHNGRRSNEAQLSIHVPEPSITGSENFRHFLAPSNLDTSSQEDARSKCSKYGQDHHLHVSVHDAEQTYWQSKTEDFQTDMKIGAEISLSLDNICWLSPFRPKT